MNILDAWWLMRIDVLNISVILDSFAYAYEAVKILIWICASQLD